MSSPRAQMLACGVLVGAVLAAACGTGPAPDAAGQPRDGRAGLQLTGTVGGRQVAVSDGAPRLIVGDCDPQDGPDDDVCLVSRDIDGTLVRLLIENPEVLEAGASVPVADVDCPPRACDALTDVAVVELQVGVGEQTRRATGGLVTTSVVQPRLRYAGTLTLEFPDGRLAGGFDVVPRSDD
ncbi:MAG TPA: hypothetical protein VG452_07235 [Egibacteraceae bacterium]|nr:hypothetical protein [Egibacteraceae bacterium]